MLLNFLLLFSKKRYLILYNLFLQGELSYTVTMTFFIANLKQNFSQTELKLYLDTLKSPQNKEKIIVIAGSYPHLPLIHQAGFLVASQNISHFSNGPHTGSVGIEQIKDLITYSIIGHSETRRELGEDSKLIAKKAKLLLSHLVTPIICLDLPYLEEQITDLKHELLEIKNLIFAFEPESAIGSGQTENPSKANEIAFKIKVMSNNQSLNILYGGSVDPYNVSDFTSQEHISGVLVGSASLDPSSFEKIVENG